MQAWQFHIKADGVRHKWRTRSGISFEAISREGSRNLEAYDTAKTWSTFIAKQIDIQSAVIKATQLGFTSIIIITHSEGREPRWKQNKEFHWYSRAPFADIQHLSQQGIKLIVQAVPHTFSLVEPTLL